MEIDRLLQLQNSRNVKSNIVAFSRLKLDSSARFFILCFYFEIVFKKVNQRTIYKDRKILVTTYDMFNKAWLFLFWYHILHFIYYDCTNNESRINISYKSDNFFSLLWR